MTKLHLLPEKTQIIMPGGAAYGIMITIICLQDHSAFLSSPAAPAAGLFQQIISQFAAAIITAVEQSIRVEDATRVTRS